MIVTSHFFLNMASFSKRVLVTTLSYKNNFSFTRKLNTFSGEQLCTRPRFYKETWLTWKWTFFHWLVPGAAPPGVYVDVLDSTSARINWREVPKEERHGIIKGYRVLYKRKQNGKRRRRSTDNFKTVTTVDGAYSILLKSLDKAAEYEVEVRAFTSVGDGPSLPNITFTTSEDGKYFTQVGIAAQSGISTSCRPWKRGWSMVFHNLYHRIVGIFQDILLASSKNGKHQLVMKN